MITNTNLNQTTTQNQFDSSNQIVGMETISAVNNNNSAPTPDLAILSTVNNDIKNLDDFPPNLLPGISSCIDVDNIAIDPLTSIIERQLSKTNQHNYQPQSHHHNQNQANQQVSHQKAMRAEEAVDLTELLLQGQTSHLKQHCGSSSSSSSNESLNGNYKKAFLRSYSKENSHVTNYANNKNIQPIQPRPAATNGSNDKSPARNTRNAGKVKRLSSNATSISESNTVKKTEKRGRKPLALGASTTAKGLTKTDKMKQVAKLQLKVESEEQLARFGNKFVIKDTHEYDDRRKKNNDAVKKCREKNAILQNEREKKMSRLESENRRLNERVNELTKELNVLKNIILQSPPNADKLPSELKKLFKDLESK